jgi:hypothetical protein
MVDVGFKHSGHDIEECVRIERLEEQILGGIEKRPNQGVWALAGHEEDGNIRVERPKSVSELAPIHVRHDQVRDDEAQLTPEFLRYPQRRAAVVCFEDLEVPFLQEPADDEPDHGLVIDDQDSAGRCGHAWGGGVMGRLPPQSFAVESSNGARVTKVVRGPKP